MNINRQETLTTLNNPSWAAEMAFDAMNSQATLMNGNDQFCREEDTHAETALEELIAFEKSHGNERLKEIYEDALAELRRNRR